MEKEFNVMGACLPQRHYMVDLTDRLKEIKKMIDKGYYFSINRGRQYGKTTMLYAIEEYLKENYVFIHLDFNELGTATLNNHDDFILSLTKNLRTALENIKIDAIRNEAIQKIIDFECSDKRNRDLSCLISKISSLVFPIVLVLDNADEALDYKLFLEFLSYLRGCYLDQYHRETFKSVIVSCTYPIRDLIRRIPREEIRTFVPWNIAAEFDVRMWFNAEEIASMLRQYEDDHHSGMNIEEISQKIFDYTQGYPVMVSWLCKTMAEKLDGVFTLKSLDEAVKMMLDSRDVAVFGSMMHQIDDVPELRDMLKNLVFAGMKILYSPYNNAINLGVMFSYLTRKGEYCVIANWLFEQCLLKYFMSVDSINNKSYTAGLSDRNLFVMDSGKLDMDRVMRKFVEHFTDVYNDKDEEFIEKTGRKLFMLYIKPIINGSGNYYIEAETRDAKRTDLVIDYAGEQFVVELKIWHGDEYKERGERQLRDYLNYFHLDKGYLLSFSFNKNKKIGLNTIMIDGKTIIEATV